MAHDVDLQQEILQKTLDEVSHTQDSNNEAPLNPCVICLDQITEAAIALPCKHASFDFLCLISWLQQRPACPLCQANITSVKYELDSSTDPKIYHLPPPSAKPSAASTEPPWHAHRRRFPPRPRRPRRSPPPPDDPIIRRRHVYRHQLYSRRVGTNRLSQYRELLPQHFNRDEELVSRARKWIRRELQVFAFLNPDQEDGSTDTDRDSAPRRANNAEFLLEYIIAILRTVDMKGSSGQAEELLQEFIGRDNARLFLHELQAWLRSPYNSLQDWDRAVQYGEPVDRASGDTDGGDMTRSSTPTVGRPGRSWPGRVSKPATSNRGVRPQYDSYSRARRIQRARDRYEPD
ncbi:hypothetical protein FQN55_009485 [Onygenales sp. PD_40]|nr:hypothetical protein FQN55_009485 [Onygenales sp. PD_40]